MILVVSGRQQGKTAALVRWLLENPLQRVVVLPTTSREASFLHAVQDSLVRVGGQPGHTSRVMEEIKRRVMNATDFFDGHSLRGLGDVEVGMDNLEECIRFAFRARVEFATVNATTIPLDYSPKAANVTNIVFDEPKPRIVPVPYDPKTGRLL